MKKIQPGESARKIIPVLNVLLLLMIVPPLFFGGAVGITIAIMIIIVNAVIVVHLMRSKFIRAEFDEETFIVKNNIYKISDISRVTAESVSTGRFSSNIDFSVYVDKELIFSFLKTDENSEEFVNTVKKHGIDVEFTWI